MSEKLKIEVSHSKYQIIKQSFEEYGIEELINDNKSKIIWWDGDISFKDFDIVNNNQRINKIPGMDSLCYKSSLIHALNQMRRLFPKQYKFFPLSFVLPHQIQDFQREHNKLQNKYHKPITWIFKPRSGCCGQGIKLIQNIYEISRKRESGIIQRYISPYLLNGFKFDFRFYILISTLQPYSIYLYKEGLTRFCTHLYQSPNLENINDKFLHLTNTSINIENNENITQNFTKLSSEVLKEISYLSNKGNDIWNKICNVIAFTMLAMWSPIVGSINSYNSSKDFFSRKYTYNTLPPESYTKYFHLLGIDILLNESLDPIVIELNDRPSMQVTFDCEYDLKKNLNIDILKIINNENVLNTNFQQILPCSNDNPIFNDINQISIQSSSIFKTSSPISTFQNFNKFNNLTFSSKIDQ